MRYDDDHVGFGLHLGFVVLVGIVDACEVDPIMVGRIPLVDVGVAEADDSNLHAVKILDDVGIIILPGFVPLFGEVAAFCSIQVVRHGNRHLLLRAGGSGGRVVQLTVQDVQTVVELMVADDPHVVADGTESLDGGIAVGFLVEECVVPCQRRALNGVACVGNKEVVAVLCPHLLDVSGNAGEAALIGAALLIGLGIVGCVDLTMHVRGREKCEIGGFAALGLALSLGRFLNDDFFLWCFLCADGRHEQCKDHHQSKKQGQQFLHGFPPFHLCG